MYTHMFIHVCISSSRENMLGEWRYSYNIASPVMTYNTVWSDGRNRLPASKELMGTHFLLESINITKVKHKLSTTENNYSKAVVYFQGIIAENYN